MSALKCPTPKKIRHESRELAREVVARIKSSAAREGRSEKYLRAYPCGDHWHVGHKPGSGYGGLEGKIRRALNGSGR